MWDMWTNTRKKTTDRGIYDKWSLGSTTNPQGFYWVKWDSPPVLCGLFWLLNPFFRDLPVIGEVRNYRRMTFSRMRSEGFPFIVGVWGWTCVRFVLLPRRRLVVVSSSPRRRVVVASSSRRRRQLVANSLIHCHWAVHSHCDTILSFKVWKVEEVSHEMLVLAFPSHKMWGHFRVLRDRRNTLAVCQCKRVVFSWQAQHFVMWPFAMSWQAQHFVTWRRCCFNESQWQWRPNVTLLQISWQAQDLVIVLKSGGSFAKVILFEVC